MVALFLIPTTKEQELTGKFFGMLRMLEGLADDRYVKAVHMTLRRLLIFMNFLSMQTVCPFFVGIMYCLQ